MTTYEEYAHNSRMDLDDCLIFAKLYFKEHCRYAILDDYHNVQQYDISEKNLSVSLVDAIEQYSSDTVFLIAYIECPLEIEAKISGGILA